MTLRSNLTFCGLTLLLMLASPAAFAVTGMQMKACEIEVLSKSKFQDLPMAAVSVYPGKKASHAHFTIRWQGLKADGHCTFGSKGNVKEVKVEKFNDGRGGGQNSSKNNEWQHSGDLDGFYYDRHVDKWRDPHVYLLEISQKRPFPLPFGAPPSIIEGYADRRYSMTARIAMDKSQQSSLKELIKKGKEQGFLTYAEVNDHLPEGIVDPEQVEEIIAMIADMGISVGEVAPEADSL